MGVARMYFKIEWHPLAAKDYKSLDGSQRVQIDKALEKLLNLGGNAGESLQGNLQGYRRLKQRSLGLRIVFGVDKTTGKIGIITIIVIGKRDNDRVYKEAFRRISLIDDKKD